MTTAAPVQPTIDERVALTFATKQQAAGTLWIEGTYPADARPDALFADFEAAGWTLDPMSEGMPPMRATRWVEGGDRPGHLEDLGYQQKDFHLTKRGTGLFTGWTDQEKTANMREARAILRAHGFSRVPTWRKTWQDML